MQLTEILWYGALLLWYLSRTSIDKKCFRNRTDCSLYESERLRKKDCERRMQLSGSIYRSAVSSQQCDHIPKHCLAQTQEQQSCSNVPPLLLLKLEKILYAMLIPLSALMLSFPARPNYDPPEKPVCSHKSLS